MLEIRLLGAPEFIHGGEPFRFAAPPRALPLLAWLVLYRRVPHAREALAFTFWPDAAEEEARGNLRRHLYHLIKALPADAGEPWIVADKRTIGWNPRAALVVDVADFERLCAAENRLDEAVRLYRGHFLEGVGDEWLEPERERLRKLAENAYLRLIARDAAAAPERATLYARRLLQIDPWREDAVRALIELRHRAGDRAGALQEYREFATRLKAELDVVPMRETTLAYEAVAQADAPLARRAPDVIAAEHAPRTNVPGRGEAPIGRAGAVAEVRALLATTRVATLAGTGGVGKTRLALEVAWSVMSEWPDGVWLADFGPLGDPALVVSAIAAALAIAQATERPELATIVAVLRRKRLLLVLDNCEHVVGEIARVVAEVSAACPDVHLLVTSREPLAVRGERVLRVPSLAVPPAEEAQTVESARAFGAVALFEARANAALPAFVLDAANVASVGDICRRLDGIPLALELAAARLTVLSLEELARRLHERFSVLTGGERTALPRQRTMRALIDWSWDLCAEPERTLLRRLAVFAGGSSMESSEFVCMTVPLERSEIVALLSALVEKSLAVADASVAGTRYRLLESIRHYALEKLTAAGEREVLSRRHAAYFAAFAERIDGAYQTTPDGAWYARATAELDNVRGALAWAFGPGGEPALGAALASSYGTVWDYGSSHADRRSLDTAYERLERAANPALTARLLWQISSISHADGQHSDWVIVAVRDRGDARTLADALAWRADMHLRAREYELAAALQREVESLQDPVRRPKAHAALLRARGELAAACGAAADARELLERALAAGHACGAAGVVAAARIALAEIALAGGEPALALANAEEARRTIALTFGRTIAYADVTASLARYEIARDAFDRAREFAREALGIALDLHFPQRIVAFVEIFAVIAALRGDVERGAFLLGFTEAERNRRRAVRGATERAAYERLFAALRAASSEEELARRLAEGSIAGIDRAVTEACAVE